MSVSKKSLRHRGNLLSRRSVLKGTTGLAAASAASSLGFPAIAQSKPEQLVIASGGGALDEAYKAAYFDSFTEKTGIAIITAPYAGLAEIKSMIEADNVDLDVLNIDAAEAPVAGKNGWLEPIDWSLTDRSKVLPAAAWDDHVYAEVAAKVMAWNTDSFGDNPPQNWVDMWNLEAFPGRRSLWKQAFQTLEVALMGDGVPKNEIYPIDVDRGLAALDKIKPELIWWDSGGQSAQFLIDGESDIGSTWNGRVYGPKGDGAPVDYTFNDMLFVSGAWCVVKGAKNVHWSMEYIAHTLEPERQAVYCEHIPYGPVVPDALQYVPAERLPLLPSSEQNIDKGVWSDFIFWADHGEEVINRFNEWLLS
jgi:putative spermidine/putrescine transport system substrate-binding protein